MAMKILSAAQMNLVDRLTTERYGIPSLLLMENAGRSVADVFLNRIRIPPGYRIYIFCGKGNNGGDGLVAARHLTLRGYNAEAFVFAPNEQLKGDARTNYEFARSAGVRLHNFASPGDWLAQERNVPPALVIIDALFGTGLSKPLDNEYSRLIQWLNGRRSGIQVISVDIPSGLFADSATVPGPAVRADLTVTFTALKPALVFAPAREYAGEVVVEPIGTPTDLLDEQSDVMELLDAAFVRAVLPQRKRDSHKGSYGHVHIVAGSRGKSGAALMSGMAALRSGAGLVTLWLPEKLRRDVIGKFPELMTDFLPETPQGSSSARGVRRVLEAAEQANVLVIGPGLTTQPSTRRLVHALVSKSSVPVVLDADGINSFEGSPEGLRNQLGNPVVVTPHPGEMARLCKTSNQAIQSKRIEVVREFSTKYGVHTILKGYQTLIAGPGGKVLINPTGNPGMATAGSGDILAGIVARFVATWHRNRDARGSQGLLHHLGAAVYLHGLAGDLAAEQVGMESLIATDLLPYLPKAFKKVAHESFCPGCVEASHKA